MCVQLSWSLFSQSWSEAREQVQSLLEAADNFTAHAERDVAKCRQVSEWECFCVCGLLNVPIYVCMGFRGLAFGDLGFGDLGFRDLGLVHVLVCVDTTLYASRTWFGNVCMCMLGSSGSCRM